MKYFKAIILICLLAVSVASALGIYFYLQVVQNNDVVRDLKYKLNLLSQNNDKLSTESKVKKEQLTRIQNEDRYEEGKEDGRYEKELELTMGLIGKTGKFFPEDKKIVYLNCDYGNKEISIESLWVLNLKDWKTYKLLDIPVGQSVMRGQEGCSLHTDSVNKSGDKIIIQVHDPDGVSYDTIKEYAIIN